MDRKAAIRDFIQRLLASKGDAEPFSDESSLLMSGRLQSADIVDLAMYLEEEFGADFARRGLDVQALDNLEAMNALLEPPEDTATP